MKCIYEVKKPNIDVGIIAQTVFMQLEKRVSFRKAMKNANQACLKQGSLGIKVACSVRLAWAEIAKTEWCREGTVALHTLRADVDYTIGEAMITCGVIGVIVWVYNIMLNIKGKVIILK